MKANDNSVSLSKEVLEMDLSTIRELISTMVFHEKRCNDEGKFVEADLIKERIENFRKLEELKIHQEITKSHEGQKAGLMREHEEALQRLNELYDNIFNKLNNDYLENDRKFLEGQKFDFEYKQKELEGMYPEHPKPSKAILHKHNILQNLKKQRE